MPAIFKCSKVKEKDSFKNKVLATLFAVSSGVPEPNG